MVDEFATCWDPEERLTTPSKGFERCGATDQAKHEKMTIEIIIVDFPIENGDYP